MSEVPLKKDSAEPSVARNADPWCQRLPIWPLEVGSEATNMCFDQLNRIPGGVSSQFKNNDFTEMCSGSEEGSYLRFVDFCITQL